MVFVSTLVLSNDRNLWVKYGGVGLECRMTQLERIATEHRVATKRDACADPIIPGKYGHLYTDDGAVMVCFTDDSGGCDHRGGRPLTARFKGARLQILKTHMVRLKQEGDSEFIAQVADTPAAIRTALFDVLMVRRFKVTKGISRPLPPEFIEQQRKRKAS